MAMQDTILLFVQIIPSFSLRLSLLICFLFAYYNKYSILHFLKKNLPYYSPQFTESIILISNPMFI